MGEMSKSMLPVRLKTKPLCTLTGPPERKG